MDEYEGRLRDILCFGHRVLSARQVALQRPKWYRPQVHLCNTHVVNMVRKASKKAFLEPGDTKVAVERRSRS